MVFQSIWTGFGGTVCDSALHVLEPDLLNCANDAYPSRHAAAREGSLSDQWGPEGASEHGYGLGGSFQLPRFLLQKGAQMQSASEFLLYVCAVSTAGGVRGKGLAYKAPAQR